jgi:NADPH:quinone reductase-like Zn-dependent oxidoreductase
MYSEAKALYDSIFVGGAEDTRKKLRRELLPFEYRAVIERVNRARPRPGVCLSTLPRRTGGGVVEEVVPGTSRFRVGDEVYGMPLFPRAANGYAEYVAAPRQLALKPRNLDHVHAAALPLVGLTA